jgi:hypothetical protein
MRASSRLMVVAIFVAVGATACGSSSKSATGSTTSNPGSGTTAPGSTGATPTTKALSGNSGSNFCDLARRDSAAFSARNVAAFRASDLKKEFENLGPALQQAENIAPNAIKGDFQTFLNAFQPYLKALAAANYDFTKLNAASVQGLGSPQVKAATDHIQQYFTQVCHITTPTT